MATDDGRRTAQEVSEEFTKELGSEVGEEFYRLYVYWLEALVQYKEYKVLFDDKEQVDMLNAIGPSFFSNVHDMMQDSLVLHITRLTDPHESGRNNIYKSLSIRMLPDRLQEGEGIRNRERFEDLDWNKRLTELVSMAKTNAEFARYHRDKRIAHLDRDVVMNLPSAEPLPHINSEDIEKVLNSIYAVIRFVYGRAFHDADLSDYVSYRPRAEYFLAHERLRINTLIYLDSAIDPEMESDTFSDELANTFYNRLNVDLQNLNHETYWNCKHLFFDFRKEAKTLRDKGMAGPTVKNPYHLRNPNARR